MVCVAEFIKICENSTFRHREELVAELFASQTTMQFFTSDDTQLLTAKHYLGIYQRRARYIEKLKITTQHSDSINLDLIALCQSLEKTPDELIVIWHFNKLPYYDYIVFVGVNNQKVYGCILGVDDRLIDEKTRTEIWGNLNQT